MVRHEAARRALLADPARLDALATLAQSGDRKSLLRLSGLAPGNEALRSHAIDLLIETGRVDQARRWAGAWVAECPTSGAAHYSLGWAALAARSSETADPALRRTLLIAPDHADAALLLGGLLANRGDPAGAVTHLDRSLRLRPADARALRHRANLIDRRSEAARAHRLLRAALLVEPAQASAANNLGLGLIEQGDGADATRYLSWAVALAPGSLSYANNLTFALLRQSDVSDGRLFAAITAGARNLPAPLPHRFAVPRSCDRRLRVAYADATIAFSGPVSRQFDHLIDLHDRTRFELVIYANRADVAQIEARHGAAARVRSTAGLSDMAAVELVRADRIDIYVALFSRLASARDGVTALKPAPIVVDFVGPASSGIAAIDYKMSDHRLHPRGTSEQFTERLVRLPCLYVFARPSHLARSVSVPPVDTSGRITFGALNRADKLTDRALDTWADILRAVAGSRLLLRVPSVGVEKLAAVDRLVARGIARERISAIGRIPDIAAYARLHDEIDIALDTFPFNGCHTMMDALWLGVPVVSLAGRRMVERSGATILPRIGLDDLASSDIGGYVEAAVRLAGDRERLRRLRHTLPERLAASPLADLAGQVRHVERAYRWMWRRWCREQAA